MEYSAKIISYLFPELIKKFSSNQTLESSMEQNV